MSSVDKNVSLMSLRKERITNTWVHSSFTNTSNSFCLLITLSLSHFVRHVQVCVWLQVSSKVTLPPVLNLVLQDGKIRNRGSSVVYKMETLHLKTRHSRTGLPTTEPLGQKNKGKWEKMGFVCLGWESSRETQKFEWAGEEPVQTFQLGKNHLGRGKMKDPLPVTTNCTPENRKASPRDLWSKTGDLPTGLATASVTEEFGNYRSNDLPLALSGSQMLLPRANTYTTASGDLKHIHPRVGTASIWGWETVSKHGWGKHPSRDMHNIHSGEGNGDHAGICALSRRPVLEYGRQEQNWDMLWIVFSKPTIEARIIPK